MSRRSVLFSPGDQPEKLRKAARTAADVVVFDLEDAVTPDRTAAARDAVHGVVSDPEFDPDAEVCVRVNPGAAAAADVRTVLDGDVRVDAVMAPKVTGPGDVDRLADLTADAGRRRPVLALVEGAAGVFAAPAVARADATDALAFGAEDLAAELGATRTREGTEVLYARERVVLAAAAAGVDALDTVFTDVRDDEGLREDVEFAAGLGYDGKLLVHPAQVPVTNDAFTPPPERVEWARRVLDARDERDGEGVFEVDGRMIDAPLLAQAETVLDRAGLDREGGAGRDGGGGGSDGAHGDRGA
jgi:citrate lyase subunit beta/citryl-CoA lyase